MTRGLRIGYGAAGSAPALGGHAGDWDVQDLGTSPMSVSLGTTVAGSTILVFAVGDPLLFGTLSDNKSNTFTAGTFSGYAGGLWAPSGLQPYSKTNAAGGASHTVQMVKPSNTANECTLMAVEARGATLQAQSIVNRAAAGAGVAATSGSVTTTGPALLVSAWSGDGYTGISSLASAPGAGWTLIDSDFRAPGTSYVQTAMAVRQVTSAGTYTVDWTPVDTQGCIIYLAAVQA